MYFAFPFSFECLINILVDIAQIITTIASRIITARNCFDSILNANDHGIGAEPQEERPSERSNPFVRAYAFQYLSISTLKNRNLIFISNDNPRGIWSPPAFNP